MGLFRDRWRVVDWGYAKVGALCGRVCAVSREINRGLLESTSRVWPSSAVVLVAMEYRYRIRVPRVSARFKDDFEVLCWLGRYDGRKLEVDLVFDRLPGWKLSQDVVRCYEYESWRMAGPPRAETFQWNSRQLRARWCECAEDRIR